MKCAEKEVFSPTWARCVENRGAIREARKYFEPGPGDDPRHGGRPASKVSCSVALGSCITRSDKWIKHARTSSKP